MKKFSFPLDRVLAWRHTQVRLAEVDLDRSRVELADLDRQRTTLEQSVQAAATDLLHANSTTSTELAALDHYRSASRAKFAHLGRARAALEAQIAEKMQVVVERRREARLLERLRDTRLRDWQAAAAREVDQLAEESHLARLVRG